jgi:uncharacterized membrane protein
MQQQDTRNNNNAIGKSFRQTNKIIKSLKAEADAKRSLSERFADWTTEVFGSMTFLAVNVIWFVVWIALNSGVIPGVTPFDAFPFGMLTTIVSLEAIILAIFVLISQNRAAKIADLREEVDLQIDTLTEQELTKLMHMVSLLLEKQGISLDDDKDLQEMLQPTNLSKIEKELEEQVIKRKS